MACARAGVVTLQLAGASGVALMGPAALVTEDGLGVATAQINFGFSHAEVSWVSAVNTTNANKDYIISSMNTMISYSMHLCPHSLVLSHLSLQTTKDRSSPHLTSWLWPHTGSTAWTGATVLEAGQLALVLVRTIRPDLATHLPALVLVMPGVPGVAGQLTGVATGQPG